MHRLLAVLLAVFIGGPTCLCSGGSAAPPPAAPQEDCCQTAHHTGTADHSSKPVPQTPCGCNKCLAKRTIANDPPQAPAIAWTAAAPIVIFHTDDFLVSSGAALPRFVIDSGPPHDRRVILARHHALLL